MQLKRITAYTQLVSKLPLDRAFAMHINEAGTKWRPYLRDQDKPVNSVSFIWNDNMREKRETIANALHANASVLTRADLR
jgi:hypothetical protein